jgi:hypothetical protein
MLRAEGRFLVSDVGSQIEKGPSSISGELPENR